MKTLTVETNGVLEFNVDGQSFSTDTEDQHLSEVHLDAINQIINQLEADGCNFVHFEDTGYETFAHAKRNGQVEIFTLPFPDIFNNLSQMRSEYMSSVQAAEAADVAAAEAEGAEAGVEV